MRILMAVSRDGYVARSHDDRMDWLGKEDKALFRALTSVGGMCAVGKTTAAVMPAVLAGRTLVRVVRAIRGDSSDRADPFEDFCATLKRLRRMEKGGAPEWWLIGGQTIALAALAEGYVSEVHLCHSDRCAYPAPGVGQRDALTPRLTDGFPGYPRFSEAMRTSFGHNEVHHVVWRAD